MNLQSLIINQIRKIKKNLLDMLKSKILKETDAKELHNCVCNNHTKNSKIYEVKKNICLPL